jgi:hypothetical protein
MFGRVEQADFDRFQSRMNAELASMKNEISQLRNSLNTGLEALHAEIKATSTVSDEIARQAATNAVESEKNVKNIEDLFTSALADLTTIKQEAEKLISAITEVESKAASSGESISIVVASANEAIVELHDKKSAVDAEYASISEKAVEFNNYLEQSKDLPAGLEATKELMDEGKKLIVNIQSLLTHALKRKAEIDELYHNIYGQDISNEEGETEHTAGKKDELDIAYSNLQSSASTLQVKIQKTIDEVSASFQSLHEKSLSNFDDVVRNSKSRFEAVDEQLSSLLPGAMAAGLSAAYEEKKVEEIRALKSFDIAFRWAIGGMVCISCIPLIVDMYLVFHKEIDLLKVLKDTPTLLFAILPLYFPVLWLAYSSNKKSNLSKRLIEEYTHKSVLGKTYSGLANQIEKLEQHSDVKAELRTKLLFNVLQVSAENPGKLITNYNKSDHPLMDALENSAKLADSVSALSKIPGFSTIATKLAAKADKLLSENAEKVKRGLDTQSSLEKVEPKVETEGDDEDGEERKAA